MSPEDDNAVEKVASENRISPPKRMKTDDYGDPAQMPPLLEDDNVEDDNVEDDNVVEKVASENRISPKKRMKTDDYGGPAQMPPALLAESLPLTNRGEVTSLADQPKLESAIYSKLQPFMDSNSPRESRPPTKYEEALSLLDKLKPQITVTVLNVPRHKMKPPLPEVYHVNWLPMMKYKTSWAKPQPFMDSHSSRESRTPTKYEKAMSLLNKLEPQNTITVSNERRTNRMPPVQYFRWLRMKAYETAENWKGTAMDTHYITRQINTTLETNNISQAFFGEKVLNITSSESVRNTLLNPNKWDTLSTTERSQFINMQWWLSDNDNIGRLVTLMGEFHRPYEKTRGCGQDNSRVTSWPSAAKEERKPFPEKLEEILRWAFAMNSNPCTSIIKFMATELSLPPHAIDEWFCNHRMRLKQQSAYVNEPQMNHSLRSSGRFLTQFKYWWSRRLASSTLTPPCLNPYFQQNQQPAALPNSPQIVATPQIPSTDKRNIQGNLSAPNPQSVNVMLPSGKLNIFRRGEKRDVGSEVTPSIIEPRRSRQKRGNPQRIDLEWEEESSMMIDGDRDMQITDDSLSTKRQTKSETVWVAPEPAHPPGVELIEQGTSSNENLDQK